MKEKLVMSKNRQLRLCQFQLDIAKKEKCGQINNYLDFLRKA